MKKLVISLAVIVCVALAAGQAQATLVGYWEFEEASGTLYDTSANHNDGSYNGTLYQQPGIVGYALGFDGVDDYVQVPDDASLDFGSGSFTLGAWIKLKPEHESEPIIIDKWVGTGQVYRLSILGTAASIWVRDDPLNEAYAIGTTSLNDDTWHHIAGVRDGSTLRIYVDGLEEGTGDASSVGSTDSSSSLIMGYFPTDNNQHFNGAIDEVLIYNHALDADAVKAYYDRTVPEPATVALLGFGSLSLILRRRR